MSCALCVRTGIVYRGVGSRHGGAESPKHGGNTSFGARKDSNILSFEHVHLEHLDGVQLQPSPRFPSWGGDADFVCLSQNARKFTRNTLQA